MLRHDVIFIVTTFVTENIMYREQITLLHGIATLDCRFISNPFDYRGVNVIVEFEKISSCTFPDYRH